MTAKEAAQELHQELQSEVYEGKLNRREVMMLCFITWFIWRMRYCPEEGPTTLDKYDIESVMDIFEDWVVHPFV